MIESRAASRYAKAMLDNARANGSIEKLVDDFRTLADAINGSRELSNLLSRPTIPVATKSTLLKEIFQGKVGDDTLMLLTLLAEKGRAEQIRGVILSFLRQLDEERGIATAEIVTAVELNDQLKRELENQLGTMSGKSIKAKYRIDPSIIGGFTARIDDRMIDASVTHQLQRLHETLSEETGTWVPSL